LVTEGGMNLTYRQAAALDAIQGAVRGALVAVGLLVLAFVAIEGTRFIAERGRVDDPPVAQVLDAAAALPQQTVHSETVQIDRRLRALTNHLARRYRVATCARVRDC
jgi:hypothetical protein